MISVKSERELELIRRACEIVSEVLEELASRVKPGVTTKELEQTAKALIEQKGAASAFKGYRGYPGYICASVNEAVVHGIPSKRELKEGDIISIDVGVKKDGYYGDAAVTMPVGNISERARRLIEVTSKALECAIGAARADNRISDISHAVQNYVEPRGYSVVRDFAGHGMGTKLHEDPQIPNFGPPNRGPKLRPGMVLAIEPMVNEGTFEVDILDDGWTVVTKDRKLSAHFEQAVAITKDGPQVLTRLPEIAI